MRSRTHLFGGSTRIIFIILMHAVIMIGAPSIFGSTCVQQPSGIIAWWRGEKTAGDQRRKCPGSLINHVQYVDGKIGQAFEFDGVDDYVWIGDSTILDLIDAGSMEVWVRVDRLPSQVGHIMTLMGKGDYARDLDLQINTDDRFHFYIAGGTQVASEPLAQTNVFKHVVATWDSTGMRIYVDGLLEGVNPVAVSRSPNGVPLQLGESPYFTGRYFDGVIDEATLYDRALTRNEVESLYVSGSSGGGKCPSVKTLADFDADGLEDITVFRPSEGLWYTTRSTDQGFTGFKWGLGTDRVAQADYDGDGQTDFAVYRPGEGVWYVLMSADNSFLGIQFGISSDIPLPADYDGDGKADIAVFRGSNVPGAPDYYVLRSSDFSYFGVSWGSVGDIPVRGDANYDGIYDYIVFRPGQGRWYVFSLAAGWSELEFGQPGDVPFVVKFNEALPDFVVFRPSDGTWYFRPQADLVRDPFRFGLGSDVPVPGDYDGDGIDDIVLFRPADGTWHMRLTGHGWSYNVFRFGQSTDRPVGSAISIP